MATSVSYYGITWTFDGDYTVGSFVTGEPYVVAPSGVGITNIDPAPYVGVDGYAHNGSMVNPVPETNQGWDGAMTGGALPSHTYSAAKNVALSFPIALNAGDSLVSCISRPYSTVTRDHVDVYCCLIVLATAPAAGTFRPNPFGTDRTLRNWSSVDKSMFLELTPVSGTPTQSDLLTNSLVALPWIEWSYIWYNNQFMGNQNTGNITGYGREVMEMFGKVALWLNTANDAAVKEPVFQRFLQWGLDIYGYCAVRQNAGTAPFYHDGGHRHGRKIACLMTGLMFNDAAILAVAQNPDIFQEDLQNFVVVQSDVGRVMTAPRETYLQEDIGRGEWGVRHRFEPAGDDRRWPDDGNGSTNGYTFPGYPTVFGEGGSGYRYSSHPQSTAAYLAIHIMGLRSDWNHEGFFKSVEFHTQILGKGTAFATAMWDTYKTTFDAPKVVVPTSSHPTGIQHEGPISVSLDTITIGASIYYTTDGSDPTSSGTRTLYAGPIAINVDTQLKAVGTKEGSDDSVVATWDYDLILTGHPAAPTNLRKAG